MNLVKGNIISAEDCESVLANIDKMIMETLRKPPLDIDMVIAACDNIAQSIGNLDIVKTLPGMGISTRLAEVYLAQISQMLSAGAIRKRLKTELGADFGQPRQLTYLHSKATARQTFAPLGVLFHIAAGNVDGLPFVSLLDGLLTGNINIVKLPHEEGGITVSLLRELFKIEPSLKEYVYVFDYSSHDILAMKRLATVADAVIVWGGDEAVGAVRKMVTPNTKIIEWGHKVSFAYVTKEGINKVALEKLALNICLTNQLFCSSCQGIFVNTDNMQDVYAFCKEFLPVLERVAQENPFALDSMMNLFVKAQITLDIYHRQIANRKSGHHVFKGDSCSITACLDSKLEPSIMYRNIWVKPLPKDNILNLRSNKNYLQTAALICAEQEYEELALRLIRAGLVKVSDGWEMSNYALGEAHDGMFPLRCYTKLVSVQNQA